MQNEKGEVVDAYVPRKCAATNQIISAKDHASIQINVGTLDKRGRYVPGRDTTLSFCGYIREMSEGDEAVNRMASEQGFLKMA